MLYRFYVYCRSALLVFLTHHLALPLLRLLRRPHRLQYTAAELAAFPAGTLGNDLSLFLGGKQLSLLPYYAKHDIKHILLGYDTTGEGEVCLQYFMLGNRHLSFPVLATVMYGVVTMPEYWSRFARAYRRGRQCTALANWDWLSLLPEPTRQLVHRINTPAHEE